MGRTGRRRPILPLYPMILYCLRPDWNPDGSVLGRIGSGNVALELLNGVRLAGDDPFDEVADGDQADDGVALQDGKMAEMALGHEGHAFVHGVLRADGDAPGWS